MLHTGDFKMDQLPLDGRLTDLRAFARLGEEGVDLFLVDSTNAEVPGFTTPERDDRPRPSTASSAGPSGGSSWPASPATCTACSRSSTPPRAHGRKVALRRPLDGAQHGRRRATWATCTCRRASWSTSRSWTTCPDDQVVLICTGSQGEPMAALSRMANRDHQIEVGEGDTVLLASSLIPGNENAVYRVINGLTRLGADVVHKGNAKVHVSGHASAGELLYCYNIVKPRNVMPVHGEWRHLVANGDLAVAHRRPARPRGARRGRRRGRPRRRQSPRSSARCRAATSTSTAPRSATSPRRC